MRNEKVTLDVERQRDHVTHQIGRGETIKEVEVEAPGDIDIQVSYMAMDHTHIISHKATQIKYSVSPKHIRDMDDFDICYHTPINC